MCLEHLLQFLCHHRTIYLNHLYERFLLVSLFFTIVCLVLTFMRKFNGGASQNLHIFSRNIHKRFTRSYIDLKGIYNKGNDKLINKEIKDVMGKEYAFT